VDPFPPAAAPAALAASAPLVAAATEARRPLLIGANLALLAAGTAATVFLWFRVFGADPSAFELSDLSAGAAPAFERTTVPAQTSAARPRTAPGRETQPASSPPAETTLQFTATASGGTPVVASQPAPPSSGATPPAAGGGGPATGGGSDGGGSGGSPTPPAPSSVGGGDGGGRALGSGTGHARGHDKDKGHDRAHTSGQGKKKGHDKHHDGKD
jgi:hypothetical protein